nr:DUF1670 domain-containing protein [Methanosarcina sp. 1.H.A.2.2]
MGKPNYGKNNKKTPLTPIVLTRISKEDLEMKKAGYSKEIMKTKIGGSSKRHMNRKHYLRILRWHICSMFLQVLNVSTGTVSKQAKEYMQRTGEILPTRGIIQDIGRAITHKRIILRLYRKGIKLQIL